MLQCLQTVLETNGNLRGDVVTDDELVFLYIETNDKAKGTQSITIRQGRSGQAEYMYGSAFDMGGDTSIFVPTGWEEATPLGYGQITRDDVIAIVSFWAHSRVFDDGPVQTEDR